MNRQRALVYGLVTALIAAAVIAFIGTTVGYGRGAANVGAPATVASAQEGPVGATSAAATSLSYDDDDDERWEDDEHDDDDEYEHEHEDDDDSGGVGGFLADLFGDDD